MPFPSDETIVATAGDLVAEMQGLFGKHPGFRPAHAKGTLLSGSFKPTPEAAALSIAPHFNNASTPILVRFSNSTGIPNIPDTDHHAEPRGIAVRFTLGDRVHTDIISHSTPFFPVRTGAEFLEFFKAIKASPDGAPAPTPVQKFVMSHPSALAFVKAPKPSPTSFAKEPYFSVTAFKLIDKAGKETYIRYQFVPELGVETLSDEDLAAKGANYLQDEIKERAVSTPFSFKLLAQVAEEGDTVDDATVHWSESRKLVHLGTLTVNAVVPDGEKESKYIIFDPIPRVAGVEPSADPLLEMRAAVYLLSGRQRRAAP
ncbi:heme-dependent catalase [Pholiota conissans]|uniref:Heme-dependent catalase n=1 Tax=Pholiota conissans TaxID=109636 RepID=A0A9P6CY65_9AGAR|nr:heme-dependent catalase [Pholiota conissans]